MEDEAGKDRERECMKKVTLGSVWVLRARNEVVETFGTLVNWIDAFVPG